MNRRKFIASSSLTMSAPFVSRHSWAAGSPMQKLQYAAMGIGGRGTADIKALAGHSKVKFVAAADVDSGPAKKLKANYPGTKTYSDWRQMLQDGRESIDIVSISTPDHMHGIMGLSAMNLGKHVYLQKPLAQNIGECRALRQSAERNGKIVQMGTQGASSKHDRTAVDLIRHQLIGKVTEAWVICGKSWGDLKPLPNQQDPVPADLNWEGWLGVGEKRPFIEGYYHPKNWRRRQGFGTGTLGDMGCHIFNAMYRGLELTAPRKVRSKTRIPNQHNWTTNERVEYLFPATRHTDGDLTVNWVSGRERPPKALSAAIPESIKYRFGCVLKGEAGLLVLRHGNSPILLPTKKSSDVTLPELNPIGHHDAFVNAVLKGEQKGLLSPIEFAADLTEFILLGNIAMQHSPRWLEWDAMKATISNDKQANQQIHRPYRDGWSVLQS